MEFFAEAKFRSKPQLRIGCFLFYVLEDRIDLKCNVSQPVEQRHLVKTLMANFPELTTNRAFILLCDVFHKSMGFILQFFESQNILFLMLLLDWVYLIQDLIFLVGLGSFSKLDVHLVERLCKVL